MASSGDLTLRDSDTTARHKFTVDSNGLWTLSESGGTQTVTGGVITGGKGEQPSGNSSSGGGGVYVDKNAAFTMEGGNITGNSSDCGGSVCTAVDKNFTVSGSVKTTDNVTGGTLNNETGKYTGGTDNNVYLLYESTCIDIGGALSNGAQIGVTNVKSSGANSTKVFTSGWKNKMSGKTPTDYFTSDNSDLIVTLSSNELQLSERPKETTPSATFTATGDTTGTLYSVTDGMKYKISRSGNSGTWYDITDTTVNLTGLNKNDINYVVKKGNGSDTADSDPKTFTLTRQATPTTPTGVACASSRNNDGKITGVTTEMVYKKADDTDWTPCTETEVTDLVPGNYDVHVKTGGTKLASNYATVTVAEYSATPTPTPVTTVVIKYADNTEITFSPRVGETLKAFVTNKPTGATYQWYYYGGDATNEPITGANDETYTITSDRVGECIGVWIYTNSEMTGRPLANKWLTVAVVAGTGGSDPTPTPTPTPTPSTPSNDDDDDDDDTPASYQVSYTDNETAGGSVKLSASRAEAGDTVTVTVTPDANYQVTGLVVKDSRGRTPDVKDNGDGTFSFKMPEGKVTVEPVFVWGSPFRDVANNAYCASAVEWALKRGITTGTGDGTTFSPSAPCTRGQMVVFLQRFFKG